MTKIAIIGSGSSAIGFVDGLVNNLISLPEDQKKQFEIQIFEKSQIAGTGLPYDKTMTSPEHLFNVHTVSISVPAIAMSENQEDKDKALRQRTEFIEWINKNKEKIKKEFEEIFFARFKKSYNRKFGEIDESIFDGQNIFSDNFNETNFFKTNQEREGFVEMLKYHQEKFKKYVEATEKEYQNPHGFPPRIVYGFYSKALFDYKIERLKGVVGQNNVLIHTQSEVVDLQKQEDRQHILKYRNSQGEEKQYRPQFIFMATGLWNEEPQAIASDRYIQNLWPSEKFEDQIHKISSQAKQEEKDSINIAIIGTSLSAIDAVRSAFKDGLEIDGVKIKVDMISRNGNLQKVKGNFRWFISEWTKYFPQALENIFEKYGLSKSDFKFNYKQNFDQKDSSKHFGDLTKEATKIIGKIVDQNQNGKIYLWQVVKLFCDIACEAYKNEAEKDLTKKDNLLAKAKYYDDLAKFIEENQNNYQKIITEIFKTQDKNPFVQLQKDLNAARDGDNSEHDYIFENIYGCFDEIVGFSRYLASDEIIFQQMFRRQFLGPISAAMPPESAENLLELNHQEVLNVRKIGHNAKIIKDSPKPSVIDSQGNKFEYDLMVDTSRVNVKINTKSPLFESLINQQVLNSPKYSVLSGDLALFEEERLKEKYGEEISKEIKKARNDHVFDFGDISRSNGAVNVFGDLFIHRAVWGVNSAIRAAQSTAVKIVDLIKKEIPSEATAASSASSAQSVNAQTL